MVAMSADRLTRVGRALGEPAAQTRYRSVGERMDAYWLTAYLILAGLVIV